MKARVFVRLKAGILDPQGATVQRALHGLGYQEVRALTVGKVLELDIAEENPAHARTRIAEMCKKLLANPVTEEWSVEIIDGENRP